MTLCTWLFSKIPQQNKSYDPGSNRRHTMQHQLMAIDCGYMTIKVFKGLG
jgi:hypothetical protein